MDRAKKIARQDLKHLNFGFGVLILDVYHNYWQIPAGLNARWQEGEAGHPNETYS